MSSEPPPIPGVRRSTVEARGVRFHVTESGPADGRPVLALHGWPQHHWAYRDLLADPPPGLRIIAPDLPGYGWSGPAPHKWAKEDVASDVLALLSTRSDSSVSGAHRKRQRSTPPTSLSTSGRIWCGRG